MSPMMLDLHSEAVPATGTIDGDATRRALGKPNLGFWEVFLRESLQNSWDARADSSDSIDFTIDAARLDPAMLSLLRDSVFANASPDPASCLPELLSADALDVLIVRDSGTRGLAGPAPANVAVPEGVRTDFRNFVFDIGRDPRRQLGGGTYGFGKGILYDASRVRTCLIYSRTVIEGELVDRFIVASVGSGFDYEGHRYTGRHWWGRRAESGILPLEGSEAIELAAQLKMADLSGGTGTTIAVLAPCDPSADAGESLEDIMESINDATMTWAWPHLAAASGEPTIRFAYSVNGETTTPSIDDYPQVQQFALAYREATRQQADQHYVPSWQVEAHSLPIDTARDRTGILVVRRALQADSVQRRLARDLNATVALMRGPRFVVRYEKIDPDPHGQYVAGVFLADPAMDETFARSEPVTHDTWAREPGRARNKPVAWTLNDIREVTAVRLAAPDPEDSKTHVGGVAHLSRTLAENLVGFGGTGAELQKRTPRTGTSSRVVFSVTVAAAPTPLRVVGDQIVVDFPLHVRAREGADLERWVIDAKPRVMAEAGGAQSPSGADTPIDVIGWFSGDHELAAGPQIKGSALLGEPIMLRVAHSRTIAVAVAITKTELS